jgi:hypothetical protein
VGADLTPQQVVWRERVEGLIALAAPALDLLLAVGERVSRIAESDDPEHYPVRAGSGASLPPDFKRSRASSSRPGSGA